MDYSDLIGRRVRIYWNLHHKCFSFKIWDNISDNKGIVVYRGDLFNVINCKFIVHKSGRNRVRREGKKNVHAFIEGDVVGLRTIDHNYPFAQVTYNPYKDDGFVTRNWVDWCVKHDINSAYHCKGVKVYGSPYIAATVAQDTVNKLMKKEDNHGVKQPIKKSS